MLDQVKNVFSFSEKHLLFIILLVFTIFSSYLVFSIKKGLPPDEDYHISLSQAYSTTLLIPENTEETHPYSDITRIPYLSFWVNARLINLNFTSLDDYLVLRLFNLVISIGSLLVVSLISKEIIKKRYLSLFPTFLLANTLMFVFLSASVSYDNLANFFVFLSVYFFVRYLKSKKNSSLFLLFVFQSLALLTKFTVIPVIFIENFLLLLFLIKNYNWQDLLRGRFLSGRKHLVLVVLVVFTVSLVLLLYGTNSIKYGQLRVGCDKILTVEQCMKNGIYARSKSLEKYSYKNFSELREILKSRITPYEYFSDWIMAMTRRTFGIVAFKWLLVDKYYANIYITLFAVLIFTVIRKWKKEDTLETKLIILSIFYVLVLLIYQNYRTYLQRGRFDLGLQGRYLFPVLPIIYIILIKYLETLKPQFVKLIIILLLVIVFVLGCIPFFFLFVTEGWFV